ncbi:MAG: HipA domain-containing protein [Bacilli bacterium]|nr:HipA domain-containing protein [Bacilli bacterium]
MRTIYVYVANDSHPIGELYVDYIRGKDVYSFAYTEYALSNNLRNYILDEEINFVPGRQYQEGDGTKLYHFFEDMMPDRWGRELIKKNLKNNHIRDIDFLVNTSDYSRMGAFRIKEDKDGPFLLDECNIPPLKYVNALEDAAYNFDLLKDDEAWKILLSPGSSLGGARPKASVFDNNHELYIAKFNHKLDFYNVSKFEYFTYLLALEVGINISPSSYIAIDDKRGVFLTKRFDRQKEDRIPYTSFMTLLHANEGESNRYTYLDIVEKIIEYSEDFSNDLKQLFKRIAFNIFVHNYDNHLRNIGMLYLDNKWVLAPAFDINIALYHGDLELPIDQDGDNTLSNLINNAPYFRLSIDEAKEIVNNMKETIFRNLDRLFAKANMAKEESTKIRNILNEVK